MYWTTIPITLSQQEQVPLFSASIAVVVQQLEEARLIYMIFAAISLTIFDQESLSLLLWFFKFIIVVSNLQIYSTLEMMVALRFNLGVAILYL